MRIVMVSRLHAKRGFAAVRAAVDRQFETAHLVYDARAGTLWKTTLVGGQETKAQIDPADVGRFASDFGADAVLVFLLKHNLTHLADLGWSKFDGPRLWWDWDSCNNVPIFGLTDSDPGAWTACFRRHGFDILLASGRETSERLCDDGIASAWVPKAVDAAHFRIIPGEQRSGLVHYGRLYSGRRLILRSARRAGIPIEARHVPYSELPGALNSAIGCVICNRTIEVSGIAKPFLRLPSRAARKSVELLADFGPGGAGLKLGNPTEPMLKNFEAAACGATPFCDDQSELADLGFVDGVTMVSYRTLVEFVDKLQDYSANPTRLESMGGSAAALVASRHTWANRASQVEQIISSLRDDRSRVLTAHYLTTLD